MQALVRRQPQLCLPCSCSRVLPAQIPIVHLSPPPQALELGSRLSGGNLNTLQDWQRAGIVAGVALVAFLGYRSYSSTSVGCSLLSFAS